MPTVDQNLAAWDHDYEWAAEGDEWSREWGGPAAQWHGSLLPRLRGLLPSTTILEIAPGFGRWTQFLAPLCARLVAIDLSPSCIEVCRRRFASWTHLEYYVNDGRSLEMVADHSVDLVFSFDSLVHCEDDVIAAYLEQIQSKLTPDGAALLHHSNAGEYREQFEAEGTLPEGVPRPPLHWRALSMSADRFTAICTDVGVTCVGQEVVNWGGERLIDCISVVTLPGSRLDRPPVARRNPNFMAEAASIRIAAEVYPPTKKQ